MSNFKFFTNHYIDIGDFTFDQSQSAVKNNCGCFGSYYALKTGVSDPDYLKGLFWFDIKLIGLGLIPELGTAVLGQLAFNGAYPILHPNMRVLWSDPKISPIANTPSPWSTVAWNYSPVTVMLWFNIWIEYALVHFRIPDGVFME